MATIMTAAGLALTTYLTTAAQKMAKKDFDDVSIRDLFKKSLQAIQWVLRIGKHVGTVSQRKFNDLRFRNDNKEIGVPNSKGEYLYVPEFFLHLFEKVPTNLLEDLASPVTDDIEFEVVVREGSEDKGESLKLAEKCIFCSDEKEILFPELVDGMEVKLEGLVTRGNENTNTIGFVYKGHILTCEPRDGDVVPYKPALFVNSQMTGIIKRKSTEDARESRPRIIFSSLVPLERDRSEEVPRGLFDDAETDGQ